MAQLLKDTLTKTLLALSLGTLILDQEQSLNNLALRDQFIEKQLMVVISEEMIQILLGSKSKTLAMKKNDLYLNIYLSSKSIISIYSFNVYFNKK
jgi:hypothetical protein